MKRLVIRRDSERILTSKVSFKGRSKTITIINQFWIFKFKFVFNFNHHSSKVGNRKVNKT
uniref:Candidate secreted effector n=1 Tax=Meloidogyne incognita TaxID=6306 RepID=A0A914P543_MELIC